MTIPNQPERDNQVPSLPQNIAIALKSQISFESVKAGTAAGIIIFALVTGVVIAIISQPMLGVGVATAILASYPILEVLISVAGGRDDESK